MPSSSHSEIKAGAFVAFSLALLFVMVFAVGNCDRFLRGVQTREVLFSSVTGLQPNSAVNYAGVEIGRVSDTVIVTVDEKVLAKIPSITVDNLDRLPLTYEEVARIERLGDAAKMDAEARRLIGPRPASGSRPRSPGRKMIILTLEIHRGPEFTFREDDVVRLTTTVMGDSTVEISPGSGPTLAEGRALLGDGSNLFTQLSDSMREIRTLLANVSDIIGEEERVNIRATLANVKKTSEDLSLAGAKVREVVREAQGPVRAAVKDLREGMAEAREAVAQFRKTVDEVKPKVVTALEGGSKMMESGRRAANTADQLMREARPKLNTTLEEFAGAARKATSVLRELEELLASTDDAMDENRPAIRRALTDLRESARNFKEMSSRIKRQPWLLLKKPGVKDQEIVLLEASARSLSAASQDLAVTMEYLNRLASDPEACARLEGEKVQALIREVRGLYEELDGRKKEVEEKVRSLERKKGGKYIEKAREEADQEK
ncbi:MAG: MlaD family protein [Planctomycetota bacterium]|jgi:ABC-type transporter Mla subunit MlaD